MNDTYFSVDTTKLEELKDDITDSHTNIGNSIEGLDNAITSMGENSWEGPDYDIFREDFITRKSDMNAAKAYLKAYEALIEEVIDKALDLNDNIKEACRLN